MDQEDPMDFKALMAKFQEDQTVLKQPRIKPSVPTKPKDLPPPTPPTSPTHFSLPAGARPSLLTSISLTSQGKTPLAPRVVFKDEKESKKLLTKTNSKKKTLVKDKGAKDTGKQKDKKGGAAELVAATPSPKASTQKKKGFLTFKKSAKKGAYEPPSVPDIPSPDLLSPEPQIPTLSTFKEPVSVSPLSVSEVSPPKQALIPRTLAPATPSLPVPAEAAAPPSSSSPPPTVPVVPTADVLDHPAPEVPALQIETPAVVLQAPPAPPTTAPARALPALPVSPPAVAPSPPAIRTPSPPLSPTPSPLPPPEFGDQIEAEEVELDDPAVEEALPLLSPSPSPPPSPVIDPLSIPPPLTPPVLEPPTIPHSPTPPVIDPPFIPPSPLPSAIHTPSVSPSPPVPVLNAPSIPSSPLPPVIDPPITAPSPLPTLASTPSIPPSPKVERPLSAQSALERVGEKAPVRKSNLIDQRVLKALEKAKRKKTSPSSSVPSTPTTEDLPPLASQSPPLLELPPIDYDERTKGVSPAPLEPAQVNGLDDALHTSPGLEGIAEEGVNLLPKMMVVPPPPPRKILPAAPDPRTPTPEKITFHPPPLQDSAVEIPAPSEAFEEDSGLGVPEFDDGGGEAVELEASGLNASKALESEVNGNGITTPEVDVPGAESQPLANLPQDQGLNLMNGQEVAGPQAENGPPGNEENVYDELTPSGKKKKGKSEATKKRKGPPKNPYAETQQAVTEQTPKTGWFAKSVKKTPPEGPDEKELKKREKQRLEKEKKEQKEQREREQRELKERQKKESEMKKKFKITGQEEAMYQAKVTVTSKGRKNDLAVTSGDVVSIIRTTNCPKGKWLARDSKGTCGYIEVSDVELDIKEMMELGKKTSQAVNRKNNNNHLTEAEVTSMGDRTSNHAPLSTGSFTDESEEWSGDEEEPLSPAEYTDPNQVGHNRTLSMPEMGNAELAVNHQHALSEPVTDVPDAQARHQALHKLSTFFHSPVAVVEQPAASPEEETSPVEEEPDCAPEITAAQEVDLELPEMLILPPPDLYADLSLS